MRHMFMLTLILAACAGPTASRSAPAPKPVPAPTAPAPVPTVQTFGDCLAEKVQTLYVASWCGHCHDQLEWLGDDAKRIRVVDCYPDGLGGDEVEECTKVGIKGFPLWLLKDGSKHPGAYPLIFLAEEIGCPAP